MKKETATSKKFSTFDDLKRDRSRYFDEVVQKATKLVKGGYERDPRFWVPTFDVSKRAKARVRFLPPSQGEEAPFVRIYKHWFRGPGGVYAQLCRTTIDEADPVQDYVSQLWKAKGDPIKEKMARELGRRPFYLTNILVIKDVGNPENEGKVFLYECPKSIFAQLTDAMRGGKGDDELGIEAKPEVSVFSYWDSQDFVLDLYKKGSFTMYDRCGFSEQPYTIARGDDNKIEQLWKSQYNLSEFVAPEQFKSYSELKELFLRVMGVSDVADLDRSIAKINIADHEHQTAKEEALRTEKLSNSTEIDDDDEIPFKEILTRQANRQSDRKTVPLEDDEIDDSYIKKALSKR